MNPALKAKKVWVRSLRLPLHFYFCFRNVFAILYAYCGFKKKMLISHFYHYKIRNQATAKDIILIYQMGKVGSKTITRSLKGLNLNMMIYQTHCLDYGNIARLWKEQTRFFDRPIKSHLVRSKALRKTIDREGFDRRKWMVITLVREPIAVITSWFFQGISIYVPNFESRCLQGTLTSEELIDIFFNDFPGHDWPLIWLDSEVKKFLEIDVFSREFPKGKGYSIFEGSYADLLLLKLERLDICGNQAMKDFLGIESFVLKNANVGKKKYYSTAYLSFRKTIVFPDDYLEAVYSHKYSKHFYGADEINRFKAQWGEGKRLCSTSKKDSSGSRSGGGGRSVSSACL